jgi:hypothetical protein
MKYCAMGRFCAALILLAGNLWPQSVLTTLAGGSFIFTGNGQPAVNSWLGLITCVTFDAAGRLAIADQ